MLPLDKAAAIERLLPRSRWRVTAFAVTDGPGQHDAIFDEGHDGPVEALMAAISVLSAAHPKAAVNSLEYRIAPVHREDEIEGLPA